MSYTVRNGPLRPPPGRPQSVPRPTSYASDFDSIKARMMGDERKPISDEELFASIVEVTDPVVKTNHTEQWLMRQPEATQRIYRAATITKPRESRKSYRPDTKHEEVSAKKAGKHYEERHKKRKREDSKPEKIGFFRRIFGSNTRHL